MDDRITNKAVKVTKISHSQYLVDLIGNDDIICYNFSEADLLDENLTDILTGILLRKKAISLLRSPCDNITHTSLYNFLTLLEHFGPKQAIHGIIIEIGFCICEEDTQIIEISERLEHKYGVKLVW